VNTKIKESVDLLSKSEYKLVKKVEFDNIILRSV